MKRIALAAGQPLKWTQESSTEHELRSETDLIATLKFRSLFGTLATAESGDGCFTFKRVGFWQSRAAIRACDSETDLAIFTNSTWSSGGTLEFPDGRKYKATTNFWMTRMEFKSESEEPLVGFHYGGFFHRKAVVEITPAGQRDPNLHLLVSFGWYLAIMLSHDAAATGVVSTG
jgi:hypothetical protein